jgi:prepilin-type N-terminal cleavage/methylation domain-containing protein
LRRAITLVEILVVVGIVAVLAAFAAPAYIRSKESAKEARCTSNLRQLYVGIELYRQDWDMGGGTTAATGYPSLLQFYEIQHKTIGAHGCSSSPWGMWTGYFYLAMSDRSFYGQSTGLDWTEYLRQEGPNAIVVADLNHNDPKDGYGFAHSTIKVKGVTVEGSIRQFSSRGDYQKVPSSFWSNK